MEKIANLKGRYSGAYGYIYMWTDDDNKRWYGYKERGCNISFFSDNLDHVEAYIAKDDYLSTFDIKPCYLKSFKRV